MFHALHKVDMGACYAKQNINLACPKFIFFIDIYFYLCQTIILLGRTVFRLKQGTSCFLWWKYGEKIADKS